MAFVIGRNVRKVEGVRKTRDLGAVLAVNNGRVFPRRELSTKKGAADSKEITKNENEILKSVFVSQSNNIFTNLAIENWLYKNSDFNKHHALLVWRNAPCVVIGRHQNPWLESNMKYLARNGIEIARRNSGGGTVYHDKGNLNLSFFTPRERYDRKSNLKILSRALKREWNLDVEITKKDDLLLGEKKVSGTASKLGRPNAYHHCTLLVDANKLNLKESLSKNEEEFETKATKSIPSHIANLTEGNADVTLERLIKAIGWEYMRTTAISLQDGGKDLISKQRGFQLINPTDQWFPGLEEIREEFRGWEWRFGRTPKFTVTRSFHVPLQGSSQESATDVKLTATLRVDGGRISEISLKVPEGRGGESLASWSELLGDLQGKKYSSETFDLIEKSVSGIEVEKVKAVVRA